MKQAIWKYALEIVDEQTINVPVGTEFLSAQPQFGVLCVWARVNPKETKSVNAKITIVGTGHELDFNDGMKFLGTIQLVDGNFVGHVFVE